MSTHGDILHLAMILAIFVLSLATFLWIVAAQAGRPIYRNGADPDSARQTANYRNGSDPDARPGCIAYRDGGDPGTVRYTKGC